MNHSMKDCVMMKNGKMRMMKKGKKMKRLWLLAVLVTALAGAGITSSVAAAGSNGEVNTHFTAAYSNQLDGNWTCKGEHKVGLASNPFVKENEDCRIDNLATLPAGTYVRNPTFTTGVLTGVQWASDFNGAIAKSVRLKVKPDGRVEVKESY